MEIHLWRELLIPYELAVKELVIKFNHLKKEHKEKDLYSPIEQVSGRVKTINSILEKMQRKNISWADLEEKVEDIAGIRVICQFYEDIDKVAEIIRGEGLSHAHEGERLQKLPYDRSVSCGDLRRPKKCQG